MRHLLWLVPVGLLLAAFGAACGGSERPRTLAEYVDRLDAIFSNTSTRIDEINAKFEDANTEAETDEEHMDAFRVLFEEMAKAADGVTDQLESLRPPSPLLDDEHAELVGSAANVASILEDFSRRADESQSLEEMRKLFAELEDPQYDAAVLRMGNACGFFENLATDNGIDLELRCSFVDVGTEHSQ